MTEQEELISIEKNIALAKKKGVDPVKTLFDILRKSNADKFINETANHLSKQNKAKLKKVLVDFQEFQGDF